MPQPGTLRQPIKELHFSSCSPALACMISYSCMALVPTVERLTRHSLWSILQAPPGYIAAPWIVLCGVHSSIAMHACVYINNHLTVLSDPKRTINRPTQALSPRLQDCSGKRQPCAASSLADAINSNAVPGTQDIQHHQLCVAGGDQHTVKPGSVWPQQL